MYVYNCADYVRIKKTKVKVQLGSAAHAIVYLAGRVFVALANGTVSACSRADGECPGSVFVALANGTMSA